MFVYLALWKWQRFSCWVWKLHCFCWLHNNGKYNQFFSAWLFENDKKSHFEFDKYIQCLSTWPFENDKRFPCWVWKLHCFCWLHNNGKYSQFFLLGSLKITKSPIWSLINTFNVFLPGPLKMTKIHILSWETLLLLLTAQ